MGKLVFVCVSLCTLYNVYKHKYKYYICPESNHAKQNQMFPSSFSFNPCDLCAITVSNTFYKHNIWIDGEYYHICYENTPWLNRNITQCSFKGFGLIIPLYDGHYLILSGYESTKEILNFDFSCIASFTLSLLCRCFAFLYIILVMPL